MFPHITCDDIFRLETARLWLRWLRAADAPAVKAFAQLVSVAEMTATIPHPYPPGEAERFILAARAATAGGGALIFGVTLKNKARTLIGLASAQALSAFEVEIGYVIAPNQAGHGYATEAARALIDAVFSVTEARAILADSRVNNPASRRVLEKCGFALTATSPKEMPARGGKRQCDFFRLERREKLARELTKRLPPMAQQASRSSQRQPGDDEMQRMTEQ